MRILVFIFSLGLLGFGQSEPNFKDEQLSHYRVFKAFQEKWGLVNSKIKNVGVNPYNYDLYIRAFKFEDDLEIWVKDRDSSTYVFLEKYKFCSNVGLLGPKRRQGDFQIPEGIYYLSKFNHESNFHLSLKVSYPNKADSINGEKNNLGGLIFIHGGCNTIGCIPITDDKIKELYVLAVQAKHCGQEKIPIHIYPARLTEENMGILDSWIGNENLLRFWKSMKQSYDLFEESHRIPRTVITNRGEYFFYKN